MLYVTKVLIRMLLQKENREPTISQPPNKLIFPIMALLAGTLGGIFGIGGGMIISPILLQLGTKPEVSIRQLHFFRHLLHWLTGDSDQTISWYLGDSSNKFLHGIILVNHVSNSILTVGDGADLRRSNLRSRLLYCLTGWIDNITTCATETWATVPHCVFSWYSDGLKYCFYDKFWSYRYLEELRNRAEHGVQQTVLGCSSISYDFGSITSKFLLWVTSYCP